MDESQKEINLRLEKVKVWLSKPQNLALVAIVLFAFIIRIYHFNLTLNQTLWWDEAEYMAAAKHFAFDIPYSVAPQRPPTFQFISSIFFNLGFGEPTIKFLLVFLPSVFLVLTVFWLGKEMFNENVGLIAAALMSVSWSILFWTSRMQPDYISMSLQVLAILFMWRYWKTKETKPIIFAAIFAGLSYHFKVSGLLVPLIFLAFIFLKDRFSAFKNRQYYYFAIVFLLTLVPILIFNMNYHGDPLATTTKYSPIFQSDSPFQIMQNLSFYKVMTGSVLFYVFLIGLVLSLKFLLYFDVLVKEKNKVFNPYIFSVLALIIISLFYMFWIKETQDRWVFLWLPFIFFLAANTLMFAYQHAKKFHKQLGIVVVLGLLVIIAYNQVNQANDLIENKLDSYSPVKQAGIWIKENSNKEDIIFSRSHPQTSYYSERKTLTVRLEDITSPEDFGNFLDENKPRYAQISVFENHPSQIMEWLQNNQDRAKPVNAIFSDPEQQQAILVVYEILYNSPTESQDLQSTTIDL